MIFYVFFKEFFCNLQKFFTIWVYTYIRKTAPVSDVRCEILPEKR
jgi:hypothetical protein